MSMLDDDDSKSRYIQLANGQKMLIKKITPLQQVDS